jgi:3-dehydroquinate dehydratase I
LQKCLQLGFDFVDIELATAVKNSTRINKPTDKPKKKKNQLLAQDLEKDKPKAALDLNSRNQNTQIILSYHNFETTPGYRKLREIQARMESFGCHICKFACKINETEDNTNLFRLLTNKTKKDQLIVLGMGNKSKLLRITSPLLGGLLTFATIENNSTASGQLSFERTLELMETFE